MFELNGYRMTAFKVNHNVALLWIYPGNFKTGLENLMQREPRKQEIPLKYLESSAKRQTH